MNKLNTLLTTNMLVILFYAYILITWVINLIQFLNCDFEEPWREEIIKGVGVVLFPLNGITVWM